MPVFIARLVKGQTAYLTNAKKNRLVFPDAAAARAFLSEHMPEMAETAGFKPAQVWFPKANLVRPDSLKAGRKRHHGHATKPTA